MGLVLIKILTQEFLDVNSCVSIKLSNFIVNALERSIDLLMSSIQKKFYMLVDNRSCSLRNFLNQETKLAKQMKKTNQTNQDVSALVTFLAIVIRIIL